MMSAAITTTTTTTIVISKHSRGGWDSWRPFRLPSLKIGGGVFSFTFPPVAIGC